MKLLHTSDWHLGKTLEGYSRITEQAAFLDELYEICEREQVDLLIVAGDIYDSKNPPAEAERLFYRMVSRIAKGGARPVLIIAGNHDSPARLTAAYPLAYEQGIIMIGTPKTVAQTGDYGQYEICAAGEGYLELVIRGERAVILLMPYPTEKRLSECLLASEEERLQQKTYSERIGALFAMGEEKYREDTINLAVGHFYVAGGEESPSERQVQLGGSLSILPEHLPGKAQYIALGHLHRYQTVPGLKKRGYYSGAPIAFRKEEQSFQKGCYLVDVVPGEAAEVRQVLFTVQKPIVMWEAENIEEAIALCEKHSGEESFVYLTIHTDRVLTQEDIKRMKGAKAGLIEILPIFPEQEASVMPELEEEKTFREEFCTFYLEQRGARPTEETISFFMAAAEEDEDEAIDA